MIDLFSLERVNKAPASFDPKKLLAFQERYMQAVPLAEKASMVVPYLQRAGLISTPIPADVKAQVSQILQAASDRIKVAGDILDYGYFFLPDDRLPINELAFDKRIRKPAEVAGLLLRFKEKLKTTDPFVADALDKALQEFTKTEGIKTDQVIHALRVAVTGQPVGFGLFETLAILGRDRCLARIDRTLARL